MESFIAVAAVLATVAALGGAIESYRSLRRARAAVSFACELISRNSHLQKELLDSLSKRTVGEQTLTNLESQVTRALSQMPAEYRRPVWEAMNQPSSRGRRDYMLKLASSERAHGNAL
ncbi:MAG: hypothetical protein ABI779_06210 [Acidobacteriota bacterium]